MELSEEAPTPYTVELWLQNYGATGVLGRIGALLLSRPETYTLQRMFELWDRVQRVLSEWGRPDLVVVANLDYGHSSPMGVLPLGVRTRVDPIERTIRTLEPAVARSVPAPVFRATANRRTTETPRADDLGDIVARRK